MKCILKSLSATVAAAALTVSTVLSSGVALAASSDGSLGNPSTGHLDLSFTKTTQAQITGLTGNTVTIASYTLGGGTQTLTLPVCIYSSTFGGGYSVNVTGNGAGSTFQSSNTIHGFNLPYAVKWDDGGGGTLGNIANITTLSSGTPLLNQTNADTASLTCGTAGNTAQITVVVTGTNLDLAPAGTYVGTLTIVITPT